MGRLSDIEIFVAVVDHGGFTAAADHLGISKSYASKRLRALEDRVGSSLLTRNTRHVAPTVLGERFHEQCAAALELIDQAEQLAALETGEPRGTLRVSLPLTFGLRYIAPLLADFQCAWPDLTIDASYTDRKVSLVEEGYDLAVRIGNLPDSELLAKRLGTSELWVTASPDYLSRRGAPTRPEDLEHHDALVYSLSADPWHWSVPASDGRGVVTVPVKGRLIADNGDALQIAALAGLGVAVQPDWLVHEAVADGRLVRLLDDVPPVDFGIWAVYPRHRHLSPKVTQFVERLKEALSAPPWQAVSER